MDAKINAIVNAESGQLYLNIFDVIRNLPEEQVKELFADGGVWGVISGSELLSSIKNDYATNNYNSYIHKIRQAILEDDTFVATMLTEFVKGVVREAHFNAINNGRYAEAYWHLYHGLPDEVRKEYYHLFTLREPAYSIPTDSHVQGLIDQLLKGTVVNVPE